MKRFFYTLIILFSSTLFSLADNHSIKKEGFFTKDFKIIPLSEVKNFQNKIILINNHGQNNLDGKQKDCTTIDQVRNRVSLIDSEVKGKKIMLYNLCAHKIEGDMGKAWWISKKTI